MSRYKNNLALKLIGERIKSYRIKQNLEIEDIAEMTGFSYNTISNIENGSETYLSYFIEICLALGFHPKELIDVKINLKPRYNPSPSRIEKSRLTARINTLIHTEYFNSPKTTREVVDKLIEDYNLDFKSKNVSTILARYTKNNLLIVIKLKGRYYYQKKSNSII